MNEFIERREILRSKTIVRRRHNGHGCWLDFPVTKAYISTSPARMSG